MRITRLWPVVSVLAVTLLLGMALLSPSGGLASPSLGACRTTHVVVAGDTANLIAATYGVTLSDLVAANNLANPDQIYVGQLLCIPAGQVAVVTATPVSGQALSSICVTGQVINKDHLGIGPGITVIAQTGTQPGVATETDANGFFSFSGLPAGAWSFRVVVPDSWEAVTPIEFPLELSYAQAGCYAVRFKLNPLGCIVAKKTDGAGNPLANWLITAVGVVDPEGVTGEDGTVRFDGLLPGTYLVSEVVPYSWQALMPSSVSVQVHAAMAADDCSLVEFQNTPQPTACVTGFKVDDDHQGLGGWKIFASPAAGGQPVFTTATAVDGSFTFPNLTLGTWTIAEEPQAYWTPITPAKFNVTLTEPSAQCAQVRFKNRAPDLCAEGYKVDENGTGLPGWTVVAYSESDPATRLTTITDSQGRYRFEGLTLGNWVFEVQHEVGWTAINTDVVKVPITGGDRCTQVPTFRNRSPRGCIEGNKRDDLNVGLPGWNISLQSVGGGQLLHRGTDGTGYFRFDNLSMGAYTVWEEMQSGWTPLTPTQAEVMLTPNDDGSCQKVQFVNQQIARDICIDGYKLDTNGDVGLPGFLVTAKNLANGVTVNATTDGLGYFRFGGLEAGSYEVAVTERDGWLPVGNAKQVVAVSWPPKTECSSVTFYNRQTSSSSTPTPSGCRYLHTVQTGETLSMIAGWYNTSIWSVMSANSITNPNVIQVGQQLCIP